ncbi:hypothetical protein KKH23_09785 [Patescibacteria group bacterium]|nr:hypothetical protein [Patescibacteria group bacterium]
MSITVADLLTKLNNRFDTELASTDITDYVEDVLTDIYIEIPALREEKAFTLEDNDTSIDISTEDISYIEEITVDGGEPLIKIDYREYLERAAAYGAGEPVYYTIYDDKVYFYPWPYDTAAVAIFCGKFNYDTDAITLPDYYRQAVVAGLFAKYMLDKGLVESAEYLVYRNKFTEQMGKIKTMRAKSLRTKRGYVDY